ncbi:ADP-ribosyltransferase [Pseudomonas sichuanensis]|uniref:dermonecrotic toxin domain-containing protein n=1 Tax=Pseudomonas sichuanensis TaxID=2213015 RepID=UPI0024495AA1|nr:DUF6543 domain-containing protein [Pseudomonas sichuanensis]MDH0733785.1 ADP-ribosyltransferase [Pseudomonas sichuanensis]MDH1581898.1 ADP-ribosyltransferase [Pseudomonas sichuanensis]MDH1591424.1 ADP-ribosyltransferase [Pseudomonas sichuanensis]MDH1597064.1 ADP-ribosyltransferase [Pseudomonas sichuanensis]
MSTIENALQHNLRVLGTGRELARMAEGFLRDFPDPYQLAIIEAARILRARTGKDWDPRAVWWHQFSGASSSSRSITGWAHRGPPVKSMRFPKLMVERFDAAFQDASDELDLYGGFYRQGGHASRYDERNEVPLLARDVQSDFWALDFAQLFRQQVNRFWGRHREGFRVLAKVNLLAQCVTAEKDGRLSAEDASSVRAMASPELEASGQVPTLAQLRTDAQTVDLAVSSYRLGAAQPGLHAFARQGGRVLLYLPWADNALRGFASRQAMAGWLRSQLGTPEGRARFEQALICDPHDSDLSLAVTQALQALGDSQSDAAALVLLEQGHIEVSDSFFGFLADQSHAQMQRVAARMVDNSQLRKAMWRGYLGAFLKVFGGFVPLGWPMSLVLLGVTLSRVGLDVDAALHARNRLERRAAMRAAILDSIFGALNMVDVGFGSSLASLAYQAPFHEIDVSLADWEVAEAPQSTLEEQEGNELLENKSPGHGRLQGIRLGGDGSCWIALDGLPYRVRYSPELSSWLIVDPDNAFAFAPLRPVRLGSAGEWELLAPPRLAGGAPENGLATESSAFWDEYMRTDIARSKAMSEAALVRQRALLEDQGFFELDEDSDPRQDEEGFDYADDDGARVYTYKHDGVFKNHLILIYTDEDGAQINRYLREGVREFDYGDEVEYLNKLADELEGLPENSEMPLYRGGHGSRSTSGSHFRSGQIKVGDVLVNTDLTSFTENPYIVRLFAADNDLRASSGLDGVFDDSSVVFELPAGSYQHGTPVSAFSTHSNEAETLFMPGSYFRVDVIKEIRGSDYHFVNVKLSEVPKPATGPVFELRTGLPFDKASYTVRLGNAELANRFFPG